MRFQETNSRHASNAIPPAGYGSSQDFGNQAASEPCKSREIPEKLSRLFERTELLSMHIAKLTGRLEPVLILRPAGTEEKTSAIYGSQLGGQLAELAARIELMIEAVDTLESQLQL